MDFSALDNEELFHLALHAVGQNQHTEAIQLLKFALERSPDDARLCYLLGVEYAQIELYDRAIEQLEQAVKQDPQLKMAAFQLGLLYLTQGSPEQAVEAWKVIDTVDSHDPVRLFRDGLQHLIRDEFNPCRDLLTRGIQANHAIPALNTDMQRILAQLDVLEMANASATPAANGTTTSNLAAGSVFIRAYSEPNADNPH